MLAYLVRLPAGEPVMLASFNDNLILNSPLTTHRARVVRAMEGIEARNNTALNDAVYYTLNYLSGRPERKILVLITDGCDTASQQQHTSNDVAEFTASIPNLIVFPIGIALPTSCDGPMITSPGYQDGPVAPLQRLASHSGGSLFRTGDARGLPRVLDAIFKRLQSEGYVTYHPLHHGEGRRDREGKARYRRVKISTTRSGTCRIESAGPLRRLEKPYREWWTSKGETDDGRALRLEESTMWGIRSAERDFRVDVPALTWVREQLATPAELLFYLLQRDAPPFYPLPVADSRADHARRVLGESWVRGQTLLEQRAPLARGLFTYPGYRELAFQRARDDYRREMTATLDHLREARAWGPDQHARIESLVRDQAPEPRDAQLQSYLAEWLGDVSAAEMVAGLERWATDALLDPHADAQAREVLAWIDGHWNRLVAWFPSTTQVRVIAPLVPAYDPERDVVGFWRVVLPSVDDLGTPRDAIPAQPLGLTFVRRFVSEVQALRAWPTDVRLLELTYEWPDSAARHRVVRAARNNDQLAGNVAGRRLSVTHLGFGTAGASTVLEFTLLWNRLTEEGNSATQPICVDFDVREALSEDGWATTLRAAIEQWVPECGSAVAD